jgi:hypothetical protein
MIKILVSFQGVKAVTYVKLQRQHFHRSNNSS